MLIFTIGELLTSVNSPDTKFVMGLSFVATLSLVLFVGLSYLLKINL